jgi:hypothetical protein
MRKRGTNTIENAGYEKKRDLWIYNNVYKQRKQDKNKIKIVKEREK